MNVIQLRDVLTQMDNMLSDGRPVPFDIKFVTADRKRETGGEIINLSKACKCVGKKPNGEVIFSKNSGTGVSRNPHHFDNGTRNLLLQNGRIRKVHIRLILEFNGQKVIY